MHHSFRPPSPDLKSQKYQNSPLFHQLLQFEIEQIWPKSMRLLGEVISSQFPKGFTKKTTVQHPGITLQQAKPAISPQKTIFLMTRSFSCIKTVSDYNLTQMNLQNQLKETLEKCSILFKFKEGENFKCRNTLSILRIALKLHSVQNLRLTPKLGKRGRFAKVS